MLTQSHSLGESIRIRQVFAMTSAIIYMQGLSRVAEGERPALFDLIEDVICHTDILELWPSDESCCRSCSLPWFCIWVLWNYIDHFVHWHRSMQKLCVVHICICASLLLDLIMQHIWHILDLSRCCCRSHLVYHLSPMLSFRPSSYNCYPIGLVEIDCCSRWWPFHDEVNRDGCLWWSLRACFTLFWLTQCMVDSLEIQHVEIIEK